MYAIRSYYVVGQKNNESGRQIQRYIRLTYLIKPMLDMVDVNKMPFMVGVTLSFLSEGNQNILFNLINDNNMKITLSQAEELKRLNILGDFTLEMLDDFFNPPKDEKENKKKNYSLKLNRTQFDTIARALKNQRDNIDPAIYAVITSYSIHYTKLYDAATAARRSRGSHPSR